MHNSITVTFNPPVLGSPRSNIIAVHAWRKESLKTKGGERVRNIIVIVGNHSLLQYCFQIVYSENHPCMKYRGGVRGGLSLMQKI